MGICPVCPAFYFCKFTGESIMNIILIGGMDRLGEQYRTEAERHGMNLQIFSQNQSTMCSRIKNAGGVVIFTNKVSHQARDKAIKAAKKEGVPVFMHHSCGICSLRECLKCLEIIGEASCPKIADRKEND